MCNEFAGMDCFPLEEIKLHHRLKDEKYFLLVLMLLDFIRKSLILDANSALSGLSRSNPEDTSCSLIVSSTFSSGTKCKFK
jgi:hypothetical protein